MWSLIVLLAMVHITSSQNCYCPKAADSDFVIRAEVLNNSTGVNNSTYSTMYTISIVEIYKLENGTNISNAVYTYGDGPCATKLEQNRQYILKDCFVTVVYSVHRKMWGLITLLVCLAAVHVESEECSCPSLGPSFYDFVIYAKVSSEGNDEEDYGNAMYTITTKEVFKRRKGREIDDKIYISTMAPCPTQLTKGKEYIFMGTF
ncbi:hypothetical protein Aduo_013577 [Ancylostoma duodenale]